MINPKDIELVEALQLRPDIDRVKERGEIRKPVLVWNKYTPDQKYQVRDGHHRVIASQERGDEKIPALVLMRTDHLKDFRKRKKLPY